MGLIRSEKEVIKLRDKTNMGIVGSEKKLIKRIITFPKSIEKGKDNVKSITIREIAKEKTRR